MKWEKLEIKIPSLVGIDSSCLACNLVTTLIELSQKISNVLVCSNGKTDFNELLREFQ